MTQEEVVEMAREAGICTWTVPPQETIERFERFAQLVYERVYERAWRKAHYAASRTVIDAAVLQEREACARIVDEWANSLSSEPEMADIAAQIRARGLK